eukprot:m.572692 g.572692  ORF g.572692 m.572692 type:complete len:796 (-) comp22274_c0_seq4:211-2598(-)
MRRGNTSASLGRWELMMAIRENSRTILRKSGGESVDGNSAPHGGDGAGDAAGATALAEARLAVASMRHESTERRHSSEAPYRVSRGSGSHGQMRQHRQLSPEPGAGSRMYSETGSDGGGIRPGEQPPRRMRDTLYRSGNEASGGDGSHGSALHRTSTGVATTGSRMYSDVGASGAGKPRQPHVQFVEEMSRLLNEYLPCMWKLGLASLRRQVQPQGGSRREATVMMNAIDEYNPGSDGEDGDETGAASALASRKLSLEAMVTAVVDSYANKVRARLMRDDVIRIPSCADGDDTIGSASPSLQIPRIQASLLLPHCEAQIRRCINLLTALGLSESSLAGLRELSADFQRHVVTTVFRAASDRIASLEFEEDWHAVDGGLHTALPETYEEIMLAAFLSISDLCSAPADTCGSVFDPAETPARANGSVVDAAEVEMCGTLDVLTQCLTRLAFPGTTSPPHVSDPTPASNGHVGAGGDLRRSNSGGIHALRSPVRATGSSSNVAAAPSVEKRLMLVMSNCLYVRKHVTAQVVRKFNHLRLGELDVAYDDSLRGLEDLDFRCFESLLNRRGHVLAPLIVRCVQDQPRHTRRSDFADGADIAPTETPALVPRPYVKEILLNLLLVHADMSAYARPFLRRVLTQLVVRIAAKFFTVVNNFELLGQDAASAIPQLLLEAKVLQNILRVYDREPSVWDPTIELLSTVQEEQGSEIDVKALDDNVALFLRGARFQYACFSVEPETFDMYELESYDDADIRTVFDDDDEYYDDEDGSGSDNLELYDAASGGEGLDTDDDISDDEMV